MESGQPELPSAQSLLDGAACGLLLTRADGFILQANKTFARWLGYEPEQLVGLKRLQDLLTMGGRIFHQTHWAPLLELQGSIAEVKLDLLHRAGNGIPMLINALRITHGGVIYHQVAALITEDRHKYERELVQARKTAEAQLAKERQVALFAEQMIGIVSHDLRNPLTAIQLSAHLLGRAEMSTKEQLILGRIISSANRATRLIADLLDFTVARLGNGLAIQRRPADLHELVEDHMLELAATFPGRSLLHVKMGQGEVHVDADRLLQLVGNLVGNAMAYGDPNQSVTVTTSVDGETFVVTVHNHGNPVASDVLQTLFEPLVRGGTSTHSQRSVGLGLFIVREIVHAHKGTITAESTQEKGTSFRATFPRESEPEPGSRLPLV